MATHSSLLAWRIPWTEEPSGLQSMGLQRVGHNWVSAIHFTATITITLQSWNTHLSTPLQLWQCCLGRPYWRWVFWAWDWVLGTDTLRMIFYMTLCVNTSWPFPRGTNLRVAWIFIPVSLVPLSTHTLATCWVLLASPTWRRPLFTST